VLGRTLRSVKLIDVSVVTHPAYPSTSVDARAAAAHYSAPASDIHLQIAAWNARHKQKLADARSMFAEYSPLTAEEIVRVKRLRYSEDAINEMRLAALTREIRQGCAFEAGVQSPRYEQGQANDPTCSLRDDDDDPDFICDDFDCSDKDHERAAASHRANAQRADSWQRCAAHHKAADRHDARRVENLSKGERAK
jgi:hypothetical protein